MTTEDKHRPPPVTHIGAARSWYRLGLGDLWQYRDLFFSLGRRDVTIRYRQTLFGAAWVLVQPITGAAIFAFVFGRIAKLPSQGVPYFVFAYCGLLGWNTFAATVARSSSSLLGNAGLVAKVYFPRVILPASTLLATLIDFVVSLGVLLVVIVINGVGFTPRLLLLPIWLGLILLLALSAGLVLGGASVRYRDVSIITPVALQLLLYASPVAYAASAVPNQFRAVFELNPLTGLLEGFRWSLLGIGELTSRSVASAVGGPIVAFVVALVLFRHLERSFADVL